MTVAELIERLREFPSDLAVTVDGYEDGYTENVTVVEITVVTDAYTEPYYGEHDDPRQGEPRPTKQVVNLSRHGLPGSGD